MQVALLLTGNELMAGDVVDSNSAMAAQALAEHGIRVQRKVTIGDDYDLLVEELRVLSRDFDALIVNGGLGPTTDDLTAEALAEAVGVPLAEHPQAMAHIEQWCARRNYPVNDAARKQAMLPSGVEMVGNPMGSAPGFQIEFNQCLIICTPGVPIELEKMLADTIVPTLCQRQGGDVRHRVSKLQVFGAGEAQLQQMIRQAFPDWPAGLTLGFRVSLPLVDVKIESDGMDALHDEWFAKLRSLFADLVIGEGGVSLAEVVIDALRAQGKTLVTAESCTGGLIASLMTRVAGASDVFEAGFVTYSNRIKTSVLGVDPALLEAHGAVSQPVVEAMLHGALQASGADIGVAVSGIAGPGGGSPEKPVGLVWVAWGGLDRIESRALFFPGNRRFFQNLVASAGLDLIRRRLQGITTEPLYFKSRQPPATT